MPGVPYGNLLYETRVQTELAWSVCMLKLKKNTLFIVVFINRNNILSFKNRNNIQCTLLLCN